MKLLSLILLFTLTACSSHRYERLNHYMPIHTNDPSMNQLARSTYQMEIEAVTDNLQWIVLRDIHSRKKYSLLRIHRRIPKIGAIYDIEITAKNEVFSMVEAHSK